MTAAVLAAATAARPAHRPTPAAPVGDCRWRRRRVGRPRRGERRGQGRRQGAAARRGGLPPPACARVADPPPDGETVSFSGGPSAGRAAGEKAGGSGEPPDRDSLSRTLRLGLRSDADPLWPLASSRAAAAAAAAAALPRPAAARPPPSQSADDAAAVPLAPPLRGDVVRWWG